jgi:hypothetical protein
MIHIIKKTYVLLLIVFISFPLISCNYLNDNSKKITTNGNIETQSPSKHPAQGCDDNNQQNDELDIEQIINAKSIDDPKSWVKATIPLPDAANIDYSSNISITFSHDIDKESLNQENIRVYESKHSRNISNLFNYIYDKNDRVLKIEFKIPENGFGTSNSIMIFISGKVKDLSNKEMGVDIKFGFATK